MLRELILTVSKLSAIQLVFIKTPKPLKISLYKYSLPKAI